MISRRERKNANPPRAMLISPSAMATMAPASPFPVPNPPAELAACSTPVATLIRPNTPAAMAPACRLPLRWERIRARLPIIIPISPATAAAAGKSRPAPMPPPKAEAHALAGAEKNENGGYCGLKYASSYISSGLSLDWAGLKQIFLIHVCGPLAM